MGKNKMEEWKIYEHRVQYYETDQMGIVHHSNYIRWFEEARTEMLRRAGIGYGKMESLGIISPVLEVSAKYKSMTHFEDIVRIRVEPVQFNGIVLTLSYQVSDKETGEIRCTGKSRHCFLDAVGHPISLKKEHGDIYRLFMDLMQ